MNTEKGSILITVILTASILGFLSVVTSKTQRRIGQTMTNLQYISVNQNKIVLQKQILSRDPILILKFSAGYIPSSHSQIYCPELRQCLEDHTKCPSNPTECAFYLPGIQLTGSKMKPFFASVTNEICQDVKSIQDPVLSKKCPLSITGYFKVQNKKITIWSSVTHVGEPLPGNIRLKSYNGYEAGDRITIPLDQIVPPMCQKGERAIGFDKNGKLICKEITDPTNSDKSFDVSKEFANLLSDSVKKNHTLEDFIRAQRDKIIKKSQGGIKICNADQIMIGVTHDGRPICRDFPLQWRFNSIFFVAMSRIHSEGSIDTLNNMPDCPPKPASKICQKKDSFCKIPILIGENQPLDIPIIGYHTVRPTSYNAMVKDDPNQLWQLCDEESRGSFRSPHQTCYSTQCCDDSFYGYRGPGGCYPFCTQTVECLGSVIYKDLCIPKKIFIEPAVIRGYRIMRCMHKLR